VTEHAQDGDGAVDNLTAQHQFFNLSQMSTLQLPMVQTKDVVNWIQRISGNQEQ
jgi:hypothetical protein